MNYQVLHMLEQAGFKFTPDVMHKLPLFEKLVKLEREACAKLCDKGSEQMLHKYQREGASRCAEAIRARGQMINGMTEEETNETMSVRGLK